MKLHWPPVTKEGVEKIRNLAEIAALILAGGWFLFRGEATSRLNISADVQSLKLTEDVAWLRCDAVLENVGSTKVEITKATARLQKMLPLEPYIHKRLETEDRLLKDQSRVVDWPEIDEIVTAEHVVLGPGEKQMLNWEFKVPRPTTVARVYLYLIDGKHGTLGWTVSRVHAVNWTETPKEPSHEK